MEAGSSTRSQGLQIGLVQALLHHIRTVAVYRQLVGNDRHFVHHRVAFVRQLGDQIVDGPVDAQQQDEHRAHGKDQQGQKKEHQHNDLGPGRAEQATSGLDADHRPRLRGKFAIGDQIFLTVQLLIKGALLRPGLIQPGQNLPPFGGQIPVHRLHQQLIAFPQNIGMGACAAGQHGLQMGALNIDGDTAGIAVGIASDGIHQRQHGGFPQNGRRYHPRHGKRAAAGDLLVVPGGLLAGVVQQVELLAGGDII